MDNRLRKKPNFMSATFFAPLVCLLIVVGTFNDAFDYFAILISLSVVLFLKEDALGFLTFIMPFANVFNRGPDTQSFFTYIFLFYVLWCFFTSKKISHSFLFSFLCLFAFLVLQMTISLNILRTVKFAANLGFIYLAISAQTEKENNKVFLFYILGIVISSAVVALNLIPAEYITAKKLGNVQDEIVRFSGVYGDPNYYSVNLIISLCLIVILNHRRRLPAILAIGLAALLVTFAIMTFSKSVFLMMLLPLLMLLYSKIKQRKYLVLIILLIATVILMINILAGKIEAFEMVLSRFEGEEDAASLTTGRTDIWASYMQYLKQNLKVLILGAGFSGQLLNEVAPHNTYIDLFYYMGLAGTFLLIVVLVSILKTGAAPSKKNLLNYSVFLSIAIMYFFLSELFYFDWPFHITLAILTLKTNMLESKKDSI